MDKFDDVMNRRIERFRNKVQVNINLADDEIMRLSNDLMRLQGEVDSTKDELNRVSIQLQQKENASAGKVSREQAKYSSKVSKVIIQNQNEINEINKQHKENVAREQKDFQKSIDQLKERCDQEEAKKTQKIDSEMKQIEEQKRIFENTIQNASNSVLEEDEDVIYEITSIENSRLSQLQRSIISKNNERHQLLISAKYRLSQCVDRLDEMEERHRMAINSLNLQLQSLDNKYHTRIRLLQENSKREIARLKNKYETFKQREENLQEAIDRVEDNQKRQMLAAVQEGEELKRTITMSHNTSVSQSSINENENSTQNITNDYNELKKKLEEKENELVKARTENESLKREVARLQYQSTLKKRQKQYGF